MVILPTLQLIREKLLLICVDMLGNGNGLAKASVRFLIQAGLYFWNRLGKEWNKAANQWNSH